VSLGIAFKGPEGIVLATDSRITLTGQHPNTNLLAEAHYDNATKLQGRLFASRPLRHLLLPFLQLTLEQDNGVRYSGVVGWTAGYSRNPASRNEKPSASWRTHSPLSSRFCRNRA
jgi:hypothetical protein